MDAIDIDVAEKDPHATKTIPTRSLTAATAYYRGVLAMRSSEMEQALGHMTTAIHDDPSYAEPYFSLINIYRLLGKNGHAECVREALVKRFPMHKFAFRALYDKGVEMQKKGARSGAVSIFERITNESVDIYAAGAYVKLGGIHARDNPKLAAECYKKALLIRPDVAKFKKEAVGELIRLNALEVDLARRLLVSSVVEAYAAGAVVLARKQDPLGLRMMREIHEGPGGHINDRRFFVASALLWDGSRSDWDYLIDTATRGHSIIYVYERLCGQIVKKRYEPGYDALPLLLQQELDTQRAWGVKSISEYNHPKIRKAVRAMLTEEQGHRTLIAACKATATLKDKESVPFLKNLLDHSYYRVNTGLYEVRKAAFEALEALDVSVPAPELTKESVTSKPTLERTAASQGVRKISYPTIACLASRQNAHHDGCIDGGYGYGGNLHNAKHLELNHYRTILFYNPWLDRANERLKKELGQHWGYKGPVLSAASKVDLGLADCAVANSIHHIEPAIVCALEAYVRGGGGLVIVDGFGLATHADYPEYHKLLGMDPKAYSGHGHPARNDVNIIKKVEHPLLKGIPLGVPLPHGSGFNRNGAFGSSMFSSDTHNILMEADNSEGPVVVIHEYEKGRVVFLNMDICCGFKSGRFGPLTHEDLYMRAVDWAGRLSEKYGDSTRVAAEAPAWQKKHVKWLAAHKARWAKDWQDTQSAKQRHDIAANRKGNQTSPAHETIVVFPFANRTGSRSLDAVAESMAPVLGTFLESGSDFRQIERIELHRILKEQKLSESLLVDDKTALRVGRLLGAKYLVVSSLMKEDGKIALLTRIQNVETTVVLAKAEAKGDVSDILEPMESVAKHLLAKLNRKETNVVLPVDPTPLANLHYMKGVGYRHSNNLGRALAELTTACRYAPEHKAAKRLLITVYKELGFDEHAKLENEIQK